MEKRALRTRRRYKQMHLHPQPLPGLRSLQAALPLPTCTAQGRAQALSQLPGASGSGKPKGTEMEGQGQHRTNGVLRHSAHTPPHTLSLAFCSVLRRTMPGECGVQVSQEAPVSAMALDDTCSSLKTRDGQTEGERAANSTSQP